MNDLLNKNKVILGLSGGVDSAVAALLLKSKGFEVIGLYFDIHENNIEGLEKAQKIAKELDIKLIIKNVHKDFENNVINNFIDSYSKAKTPNPCIICNPTIKFKTLIDTANEEKAYHIATGHYAKIVYSELQKSYVIAIADNISKDQSYMLSRLTPDVIERIIFPLSEITDKEYTREIAKSYHISNAYDKDSQEICFLPNDVNYVEYLRTRGVVTAIGNFIDSSGRILGKHKGITSYTIGQRKGLGIALGKPTFVTAIDAQNNTVTLGDNEELFHSIVVSRNNIIMSQDKKFLSTLDDNEDISAKIRYTTKPTKCKILKFTKDKIVVEFETKQRAVTPGQSLVIYYKDEIISSGIISINQAIEF